MNTNIHAFEALGDPTRRKLLERLRQGACSVNELVMAVSVSQPAVSQHLRVLREARLVQLHKQAQHHIYSLNPAGLAELRFYFESFWEGALDAFQKAAEDTADQNIAKEETQNE